MRGTKPSFPPAGGMRQGIWVLGGVCAGCWVVRSQCTGTVCSAFGCVHGCGCGVCTAVVCRGGVCVCARLVGGRHWLAVLAWLGSVCVCMWLEGQQHAELKSAVRRPRFSPFARSSSLPQFPLRWQGNWCHICPGQGLTCNWGWGIPPSRAAPAPLL